ncbi:hypothetical protein L5515_006720 [Caenorhabditis briggsae]|uniref:Uncharacterized protein n=1 Tax=Caenorhabditis briggsae TaxID=6238 RepID=A0AAE9JJU2_CAEBR|nr:hypothetical protein L5515_006720 [Caenorhabditis briggsae]
MCGIDLLTPTTCVNIQCVLGTCYQTYWLNFERVVYILIVILTFVLTFKLLIWNIYKKQNISKDLKKANHLALIECCILIISELIPPTTQSLVPDAFTYLGAIISACQTLGFVVEGLLVTVKLNQKYKTTSVTSTGKMGNKSTAGNTTSEAQ